MRTSCASAVVWVTLAAAAFAAQQPVGQVVSVQGQAVAIGEKGPRDLLLRTPIFLDDQVITRTNSSLQVLFTDDSILTQGANSKMIIEEYSFAPGRKADNAFTAKLDDGLFRIVTEKIARENPDRVKVRTRMATMAVRGCDVVFWVASGDLEVLVLALGGAHEVQVRRTDGSGGGPGEVISIRDPGVMAILRAGMAMEQGRITDAGLASFLNGLVGSGGDSLSGMGNSDSGPLPPSPPPVPPPPPPVPPLDGGGGAGDGDGGGGGDTGGGSSPSLPSTSTTPAGRTFVLRGGGSHWSWGDWETGGAIDGYEFASAAVLSDAAFSAIAGGMTTYSLSGSGVACATIEHNGSTAALEGTCTISIQAGGGVSPVWDGTFSEANGAGDSLRFEAEGSIGDDGRLTGNQTSYSMRVHGTSFDRNSITAEQVSGRVVGPGSGASPISGGVGSYSFSHGGQATVHGGFGADVH